MLIRAEVDDSLNLPRLLEEECILNESSCPIKESDDGRAIVRFSNLYELSNSIGCSIKETMDIVLSEHGYSDGIAVALQSRYYHDNKYREAVDENAKLFPIHFVSAGIDEEFCSMLETCIEVDMENGTTIHTEDLLAEGVFGNIVNAAKNVYGNVRTRVASAVSGQPVVQQPQQVPVQPVVPVQQPPAPQQVPVQQPVQTQQPQQVPNQNQINAFLASILGANGAAFASQVNDRAVQAANGHEAAKMINNLNAILKSLSAKYHYAPPDKQGLLSRMIAKIKEYIQYLGRKVGLVK